MASVASLGIVSDIHGHVEKFRQVLIHPRVDDRLIIVAGDAINRGPDSPGVISLIVELQESKRCVWLRGNHEAALLAYANDPGAFVSLAAVGGLGTVRQYVDVAIGNVWQQFMDRIPRAHLAALRRTAPFFETDDLWVAHQIDVGLGHRTGKYVVTGHRPQAYDSPQIGRTEAQIDTGAAEGGPLSMLLWPELEVIQSS